MNLGVRSITSVAKQNLHKNKSNQVQTEHKKADQKNILKLIKKGYIIVGRSDIDQLRKAYQSNPLDHTNIKAIGRITK